MATKKAEMEHKHNSYLRQMDKVKRLLKKEDFAEAIKNALEAWECVDGMMQYARKYQNKEFESIEAIDCVLKYAPLLFDFASLDTLQQILKTQKRIEKNTNKNLAELLAEARHKMKLARALWNYLDKSSHIAEEHLVEKLGGDQDQWQNIVNNWEHMGVILRRKEKNKNRLELKTQMQAIVEAKCINCGAKIKAAKSSLLMQTHCSNCNVESDFILAS